MFIEEPNNENEAKANQGQYTSGTRLISTIGITLYVYKLNKWGAKVPLLKEFIKDNSICCYNEDEGNLCFYAAEASLQYEGDRKYF